MNPDPLTLPEGGELAGRVPPVELADWELMADLVGYHDGCREPEPHGYDPEAWVDDARRWLRTPRGREIRRRLKTSRTAQPRWRRRLIIAAILGIIVAFALGYAAGRADAAPRTVQVGPAHSGASLDLALVPAAASADVPPAGVPSPAAASQPSAPAVSVRETANRRLIDGDLVDPGTTAPPPSAWMREGLLAWAAERHGPAYLAVPWGRGALVELCGPGGCLTMMSTDAGPDLAMQRAGRVGDLAVGLWEGLCAVPRTMGLCPVTLTLVRRP